MFFCFTTLSRHFASTDNWSDGTLHSKRRTKPIALPLNFLPGIRPFHAARAAG